MFSASNPYDDLVAKTTDEKLTGENWELIISLCDKVTDEGENGARSVVAAVLKRLAHRNPNVQLYALSLADALSKNCGDLVNREISSRSFTQGLERIVTDRTTHDKVKKRTLALILEWTEDFDRDPSLGIMKECYESLKSKNFKFERFTDAPPPAEDDSLRRKEEEELQRVLEMSLHDKGGRDWYVSGGYTAGGGAASSSGAGSSAARATSNTTTPAPGGPTTSSSNRAPATSKPSTTAQTKAHTPPPAASTKPSALTTAATTAPTQTEATVAALTKSSSGSVTKVRALHNFEPTELGELAFEKGDIIKVVDRAYDNWWRGQLKGKTGIFPVNYVEVLPEPTPADIAKEAQMEVEVFAQADNIDKLLTMLKGLDPNKDNLAENEEVQELYRQSMLLRPKIVKLIDRYNQKKLELTVMNESFVKARTMFDAMMEESLAKHTSGLTMYDIRQRMDQMNRSNYQSVYGGGWNPNLYGPQPNATPAPAPAPQGYPGYPQNAPQPYGAPPHDYVQPYGPAPPVDPHSAYAQQMAQQGYQYPGQQPPPAIYQPQMQPQQPQHPGADPATAPGQQPTYAQPGYPAQPQQQSQQPQHPGADPAAVPGPQPAYTQPGYPAQPQPQAQVQQQPPPQQQQPVNQGIPQANGYPQQQGQPNPAQSYAQPTPQAQHQPAPDPKQQTQASQPIQPQAQPVRTDTQTQGPVSTGPDPRQPQGQGAPAGAGPGQQQQQQQAGPPYVWSPTGTYPDPGAQAWAQYYAQGGVDPAGRVYFTPDSLPPEGTPYVPPGGPAPAVAVTQATPASTGAESLPGYTQNQNPSGQPLQAYGP
ncbi:ESCRT-0 subunit protein hse1 [Tulasnella sp. 419]|nr:ESCRT-0 subunit protein hse1 [Tulasnella sp. 419]